MAIPIDPQILDQVDWHHPLDRTATIEHGEVLDILEERLPGKIRTVIELRVWGRYTFSQIGVELGCTKQTAWRHYQQGIQIIKRELTDGVQLSL